MADSQHGSTRRKFLALAGAGAAAAGTAAILPAANAEAAAPKGPAHAGPIVAHIKNAKTGEIAVMAGEREVVVRDRALADTLARIAGSAK